MIEKTISTEKEAWKALVSGVLNLKRLSPRLLADRDFMQELVSEKGEVIAVVQDVYNDDEELILLALDTYSEAILYASERIRNSRDSALKALALNPVSYAHFTEKVRLDYEVASNAVSQKKRLFQFVPPSLQEHVELRHSVGLSPLVADMEKAEIALAAGTVGFDDLILELQSSKNVILLAAKSNPMVLKRIDDTIWDEAFTLDVLALELSNWKYLPLNKKQDDKFLNTAVSRFPDLLYLLPRKYQKDSKFQILGRWDQFDDSSATYTADYPVDLLSSPLRLNRCFLKAVLGKNGLALEFCSNMIKDDVEMVAIAFSQNPDALQYSSEKQKQSYSTKLK